MAVYTRRYSELPPFQRAGYTEYALLRQQEGTLRLVVRARRGNAGPVRAAQCELVDVDTATARCLLCFLYENAVSVENVCDILQDIFSGAGKRGEE